MGVVLGFVSGKGGMGTTALCAGVAVALAQSGKTVLCIDCHDGMGDLGGYLGLGKMPDLTYWDVCRGDYALEQAASHPEFPHLRFLAAPLRIMPVEKAAVSALVEGAKEKFDFVLLDRPEIICPSHTYLLVTHATMPAIAGARRMADSLQLQGAENVRLLVNAVDTRQMAAMKLTVDDVIDQVGVSLLGVVPQQDAVSMAAFREQSLISYTKKGAAAACLRIAERLQGKSVRIPGRLI